MKTFVKLFLLMAMMVFSLGASAQNTLNVWQKSGEIVSYAFSEKPVITYSSTDLVLTTNTVVVNYPLTNLRKLTFGDNDAVKLGDINSDGVINVGDLTSLISMIMDGYAEKDSKFTTADVNKDGSLNVGDITTLVSLIMSTPSKAQAQDDEIESADVNTMTLSAVKAKAGDKEVPLSFGMVNEVAISAFQFDLVLPENIQVAKDEDQFLIAELSSARTTSKKHILETQTQKDGSVRFLMYSNKNYDFTGNEGEVCTAALNIGSTVADGIYEMKLKNIALSTASSIVFTPADVTENITIGTVDGVQGVTKLPGDVKVQNNVVTVNGIAANAPVSIYSVDGKLVKTVNADANGYVSISIDELASGIYVVKSATVTFKMNKK